MQLLRLILLGCLFSNPNIFAEILESNCCETDLISKVSPVKRLQGEVVIFDAILLLKFNDLGKIAHRQEVYSVRKDL